MADIYPAQPGAADQLGQPQFGVEVVPAADGMVSAGWPSGLSPESRRTRVVGASAGCPLVIEPDPVGRRRRRVEQRRLGSGTGSITLPPPRSAGAEQFMVGRPAATSVCPGGRLRPELGDDLDPPVDGMSLSARAQIRVGHRRRRARTQCCPIRSRTRRGCAPGGCPAGGWAARTRCGWSVRRCGSGDGRRVGVRGDEVDLVEFRAAAGSGNRYRPPALAQGTGPRSGWPARLEVVRHVGAFAGVLLGRRTSIRVADGGGRTSSLEALVGASSPQHHQVAGRRAAGTSRWCRVPQL